MDTALAPAGTADEPRPRRPGSVDSRLAAVADRGAAYRVSMMRLERRLAALTALSVGLCVIGACLTSYFVVRTELYERYDSQLKSSKSLVAAAARLAREPGATDPLRLTKPPDGGDGSVAPTVQVLSRSGRTVRHSSRIILPVDAQARRVARAGGADGPRTVSVAGHRARLYVIGLPHGGAVQFAVSLHDSDTVLFRLRLVLVGVLLAGIAIAAALAWLLARPFARLIAELGRSNAALDSSLRQQRQLVADASHELRTPITSLRTNVELLAAEGALAGTESAVVLDDLDKQSEELTELMSDLIELARGDAQTAEPQDVRLDALVREAVVRAERHAPPGVRFDVQTTPVSVQGVPERLGRAVNNLLDNAAQHTDPAGPPVAVRVDVRGLVVRDHGAGIADADLPLIFDRFYRGEQVRARSGSGLGLAIVRQVAESHGGRVGARNAPGGGAELSLLIPALPVDQAGAVLAAR